MFFLEISIVLLSNIILFIFVPFLVRIILFFPKKKVIILNHTLIFTPGYLLKKKDYFLKKFEFYQKAYKNYCDKGKPTEQFIKDYEIKIHHKIFDSLKKIEKIPFIPKIFLRKLHNFITEILYIFTKMFIKDFLPYVMSRYDLTLYIEMVKLKLDSIVIVDFIDKYFFKYIYLFLGGFGLLIGIFNVLIFILIKVII